MREGRGSRTAEQNALSGPGSTPEPTACRACAARPSSRSTILLLFTYGHRDVLTTPDAFIGTKNLFASLERAGEKLTFGIEPSELPGFLAERGLSLESDLGAAEYRKRYFGDAARRMRGGRRILREHGRGSRR